MMPPAHSADDVVAWRARLAPTRAEVAYLPVHVSVTTCTALAALAALALRLYDDPASHDPLAIASGIGILGLIAYVRYFVRMPWISAPVVYLFLFFMFHCGMTFTAVFMPWVLEPMAEWEIEWLYWPNVRVAMILSVVAAAGFVFGVGLLGRESRTGRGTAYEGQHDAALHLVGWLIMLAGLAVLVLILARNGGAALLSLTYLEFRASVLGPTMLQDAMDYSHLGCLLAVCGAGGRRWVKPLAVWSVFAGAPMLLLGMRGEAMIPLVSFMVVLTRRGIHFRRRTVAAAVLTASVVVPAIRTFREVGFANRDQVDWTEMAPVETAVELGGSLRAVKAYVDWIERGDEHILGASYWAPFDRQILTRVLPGRQQIPWGDDPRIPLRLMDEREGAVGGSTVGEAYYNFGPVGPFVFMAFVGVLFGWLERRSAATPAGCAFLGVMMLLFIPNIRGDFLAIPAQVAHALAILVFCRALHRLSIVRSEAV